MGEFDKVVEVYKKVRNVRRDLHQKLTRLLSEPALMGSARELGVAEGDEIAVENQAELAILTDYALFNHRERGMNAIERMLAERPAGDASAEASLLKAMTHAKFSVYLVKEVIGGVGVKVSDRIRGGISLVCDIGLGRSAGKDMNLVMRLVPLSKFSITTGAALPMSKQMIEEIRPIFAEYPSAKGKGFLNLSPAQDAEITARILRVCLGSGAAAHVQVIPRQRPAGSELEALAAPVPRWVPDARPVALRSAQEKSKPEGGALKPAPKRTPIRAKEAVGRNQACPCGSGMKFKKCCGKPMGAS